MNVSFVDKALVALVFVIVAVLACQRWLQIPVETLSVLKEALTGVIIFFIGKKVPQDV